MRNLWIFIFAVLAVFAICANGQPTIAPAELSAAPGADQVAINDVRAAVVVIDFSLE